MVILCVVLASLGYWLYITINNIKTDMEKMVEIISEEQDELEGMFIEEVEEIKDAIKGIKGEISTLATDNAQIVVADIPEIVNKVNEIDERLRAVELITGKRVIVKKDVDTSLLP